MALQLDFINYNLQFAVTILSFIIITVILQLFKKQLRCKYMKIKANIEINYKELELNKTKYNGKIIVYN